MRVSLSLSLFLRLVSTSRDAVNRIASVTQLCTVFCLRGLVWFGSVVPVGLGRSEFLSGYDTVKLPITPQLC